MTKSSVTSDETPSLDAPRWILGGRVRFKTGGPVMTVLKTHPGNKAMAAWFEGGEMHRKIIMQAEVDAVPH